MGWYHLAAKAGYRRSLDRPSGLVARGVRPTSVEELVLPLNEGEAAAEDPEVPADGPIADSDPPTDAGSETALTTTTDAGVDAAPTTPTDGEDGTVPSDEGLVAWLAELASPDPAPDSAPVRNRARPPEAREGPDGPDAIEWFDDPVRPDASANESVTAALATAPSANEDGAGPLAAPLANGDGATSPADEPALEASKPVVEAAEPAFAGLSVRERIDAGLRAYRVRAYDQAMAAWQPLAEGGHTEAQFFVGGLHLEGAGVPQSAATAFFWWTLAEKEGHAKAGEMLALIDSEVSDDDHDAMLRRVGAWVPLAPAAPPVASAPVVALLAPPIGLPQPHAPSLAPADVPALPVLLSPYGPGVRLEPGTEALVSDQPTGERAAAVRPVLPAPAAVLAPPPPVATLAAFGVPNLGLSAPEGTALDAGLSAYRREDYAASVTAWLPLLLVATVNFPFVTTQNFSLWACR